MRTNDGRRKVARARALALLLCLGSGTAAKAADAGDVTAVAAPVPPLGLQAGLGFRSDLVRSTGLDAFSAKDAITQASLSASYRFGAATASGLGVGLDWDHGGTSSSVRGSASALTIDRLALALQGRIALGRRLLAHAYVAPGLLRTHATLDEASAVPGAYTTVPRLLQQTTWAPSVDAAAGLTLLVAELRGSHSPLFGFWLTAEGGYGYSGGHEVVLSTGAEAPAGRTDAPARFGTLAVRGAFTRFGMSLTF